MFEAKEIKVEVDDEFDHLLKLLDDEDDKIYANIRERFLSYGDRSSKYLERFIENENALISKRAREIISILNFDSIEEKFRLISKKADSEILEEVFILLAAFGYPEVDTEQYTNKFDKMAHDVKSLLPESNTGGKKLKTLDILNTLNNYLFFEKNFKGNSEDYYNPDNSYLNRIFESGLGIPISLSVIYMLIARRLDLPVYGISLPGHFILKFSDGSDEFFIDPFNKGVIISVKETEKFIEKAGLSKLEFENSPFLKGTSDREIVLRMMRNLKEIYIKQDDLIKSGQLERLMSNFS